MSFFFVNSIILLIMIINHLIFQLIPNFNITLQSLVEKKEYKNQRIGFSSPFWVDPYRPPPNPIISTGLFRHRWQPPADPTQSDRFRRWQPSLPHHQRVIDLSDHFLIVLLQRAPSGDAPDPVAAGADDPRVSKRQHRLNIRIPQPK